MSGRVVRAMSINPLLTDSGEFGGSTDPYRPTPDPATGELRIDPEIVLRARGFGLEVGFYYSTTSSDKNEYGNGRSSTAAASVVSQVGGQVVTLLRGDFSAYPFSLTNAVGAISFYTPASGPISKSTLTYNAGGVAPPPGAAPDLPAAPPPPSVSGFTELLADGSAVFYQDQTGSGNPRVHKISTVTDANGNVQTFTYGTGAQANLLQNIQEPAGRRLTFSYMPGTPVSLLSYVQDWGGRRWTMQYDASNNLTTLTAPIGCQTQYNYSGSQVTSVVDPRGYSTGYNYESQGRVSALSSGTAAWSYSYAPGQTVVQPPLSNPTTYLYECWEIW